MAEEKKVSFGAQDAGLSAFMKKMMQDGKSMYDLFAKEAAKQTSNQKEQFKIINEMIKSQKESLKIEKEITQEKIKQAKETLKATPAFTSEGAGIRNDAKRTLAKAEVRLAEIEAQKRGLGFAGQTVQEKKETGKSIFSDIVKADVFKDIIGMLKQIPSKDNGLGLLTQATSIAGAGTGAAFGTGLDLANVKFLGTGFGDIHASTTLSALGKEMGAFMGEAITRSFKTRDQYDQSYNKFRALGGKGSTANLSAMGFDDIAVAAAMGQVTQAAGTSRGAAKSTLAMLGLNRGLAIDESASLGAIGLTRSGAGNGVSNMQKALGVAIAEGLDRAKFSDVIKSQTQLLQHFAMTSNNVSSTDANRAIFEFNRMGGMFSAGDPRAMGNIMGVNQGLTSPNSAFGQAQNYAVLRRLFPGADPFELKKREEQGLQTPGFLKGVMDQIGTTGVSDTMQKFMLKARFGNLSFEAIDTLFANKDKIGSMNEGELSKMVGINRIQKEAEDLTSRYTRMNAEVTNAFREDFIEGIHVISAQFVDEMGRAIDEVKRKLGFGDYKQEPHNAMAPDAVSSRGASLKGWYDSHPAKISKNQQDEIRKAFPKNHE